MKNWAIIFDKPAYPVVAFGYSVPPLARKRLRRIPKAKRKDVTRGEYNALVDMLNERGRIIDDVQRALQIQFRRIAQIQAELDELRGTSKRSA